MSFSNKTYQFSVADAQQWKSVDIAVILFNLRFWLDKNKANHETRSGNSEETYHVHDGQVWTYNTAEAWQKLFPWLSVPQIRRLLKKMEDDGILIRGNYNKSPFDKTVWYSLNEPEYQIGKNDQNQATAPETTDVTNSSLRCSNTVSGCHESVTSLTDNKQHIKSTTTTTERNTKISFEDFALCLIQLVNDMISEGGWVTAGQPAPKAKWLMVKAQELYEKFPDPSSADCALIVLKDWSKLIRNNIRIQTDHLPVVQKQPEESAA